MGFRSLFSSKKKSSDSNNQIPEAVQMGREQQIIEIAAILSNQNENIISDMSILAQNCELFYAKHKEWCDEVILEKPKNTEDFTRLVLAYWLAGYDRELQFGAYIDWKEEPKEILFGLRKAVQNLHYPLDVDHIKLGGNETTDEALKKIDAYLKKKGYTVIALDTDSDSYHLFLAKLDAYPRLEALGKAVSVKFLRMS